MALFTLTLASLLIRAPMGLPQAPARRGGAPRLCADSSEQVVVRRLAGGGLGLVVDPQTNVIAENPGQPALRLGDVIVAVDGEACGRRYIGQFLKPGAEEYTFTVERGTPGSSRATEDVVLRLCSEVSEAGGAAALWLGGNATEAEAAQRILGLVEALEAGGASAAGVTSADLAGFWRLRFSDDPRVQGGLSGFGRVGGCRAVAQWQLYGKPEPASVQCVEVISNPAIGARPGRPSPNPITKRAVRSTNASGRLDDGCGGRARARLRRAPPRAGVHQVAALKGTAEAGEGRVQDTYSRFELGGSPMPGSATQRHALAVTHLGERIRVCRAAEGGGARAVRLYERQDSVKAQAELRTLAESPVVGTEAAAEEKPGWQIAEEERYGRRSGGNGGGGPQPQMQPQPTNIP